MSTEKPPTLHSTDEPWDTCATSKMGNEGRLVGSTDTQEALALAAIIIACTPIVVAVLAAVTLLVILCAAVFLFLGLTLAAVFAVFLGATIAAASQ